MFRTKNRWLIAAAAIGIHTSIGSVYAYSAWTMPLENTFGWTASQTALAFSIAIFFLGVSAACLGRFIERKGALKGGLLSAVFFSTGLIGSAVACWWESLPLFYLFFGAVSGIGLGLGYIAPVPTLLKWFPDRRGLASGLAIMGFGFGGLICVKLIDQFVPPQAEIVLSQEISLPEYQQMQSDAAGEGPLLSADTPDLHTFKTHINRVAELFRNNQADTPEYDELKAATDGFRTVILYEKKHIASAFLFLGIIYFVVMVPSALYIAPPPPGYAEKLMKSGGTLSAKKAPLSRETSATEALRTPAFYGLWFMLFINASCGIALIATAKKMGYEMVRLPVETTTVLVMGISLFNGLGRILWAALSDLVGRGNTFVAFFAIQMLAFPLLANLTGSPLAFMAVTFLILTCYGGGFSCIPAYISDLFGLKSMPTLLGFILTAWSIAGIFGPMLNAYVYEKTHSYQQSLYVFGGAFVIALIISLLMKLEIKRLHRHYEKAEIEAARPHTHGV